MRLSQLRQNTGISVDIPARFVLIVRQCECISKKFIMLLALRSGALLAATVGHVESL